MGDGHSFPNAEVKLVRATSYSSPMTDVATLTLPSAAASRGRTKFAAPDGGVHLAPNTTYFLLVRQEDAAAALMGVTRPQWGSDGAPGWSTALPINWRDPGDTTWDPPTSNSVMAIEIVGMAPDETAPEFSAAAVNVSTLTVTFNEALAAGSKPAPSAFTVTAAGSPITVSEVAIEASTVTLTLASRVFKDQAVTVGYTKPAANPLKDSSNNEVANFSGKPVTNSTPPPAVSAVAITSDPGLDNTYGLDETIEVTVTFNQPVTVDTTNGTPSLIIDFHSAPHGEFSATYRRGSDTTKLVFGYDVIASNVSLTEGVAVKANSLRLNGGMIGGSPTLTHTGLGHNSSHLVDGSKRASHILVSNIGQTRKQVAGRAWLLPTMPRGSPPARTPPATSCTTWRSTSSILPAA